MIKSAIGWSLSYVLYGIGHVFSLGACAHWTGRIPEWMYGAFFWHPYQKFMMLSHDVQEWGNDKGPWRDVSEEDHIGDMYGDV